MDKVSSKYCEACKENKVRTICDECREFYCENCSDYHLRFKATREHRLIDLFPLRETDQQKPADEEVFQPPEATPPPAGETELSSDFRKSLTMGANTVLYRAAQVAMGGGPEVLEAGDSAQKSGHSEKENSYSVSAAQIAVQGQVGQCSIKTSLYSKDMNVRGILILCDKVIVADCDNSKLNLFDLYGTHLSAEYSIHRISGIAKFTDSQLVTYGDDNQIRFWTLRGKVIKSNDGTFNVGTGFSNAISYNGTYFCATQLLPNVIKAIDMQGRLVKKIVMEEVFGKKIAFGSDIHMDSATNDIYIPCVMDNRGVLCVSLRGEPLWFSSLKGVPRGITDIRGVLCVAVDGTEQCLHLVSMAGKYEKKLLGKDELAGYPMYMYYDSVETKLYFSLYDSYIVCSVYLKV